MNNYSSSSSSSSSSNNNNNNNNNNNSNNNCPSLLVIKVNLLFYVIHQLSENLVINLIVQKFILIMTEPI